MDAWWYQRSSQQTREQRLHVRDLLLARSFRISLLSHTEEVGVENLRVIALAGWHWLAICKLQFTAATKLRTR